MGVILSRFRKKKTTIEVLEELDVKIKVIRQYETSTEQKHKKIVGRLIICSATLYIVFALIFYFYFFPASLYDQLFYIIPLLTFPLLIMFTKKMVTWYYNRKISRNHDKLTTMEQKKKKILEEVTETETYKKAKEILLRFAPDQLRMTPLTPQQPMSRIRSPLDTPRRPGTPQPSIQQLSDQSGELRRRAMGISSPSVVSPDGIRPIEAQSPPSTSATSPLQSPQVPRNAQMNASSSTHTGFLAPRRDLPRPVIAQQRGYMDRLVDYLVGDGPSNRYALVCSLCSSHNGMALKEEFEYLGFRCCYCSTWNPARKQKPSAPKLESDHNFRAPNVSQPPQPLNEEGSVSSAEDSDSEVIKKMDIPDTESSESLLDRDGDASSEHGTEIPEDLETERESETPEARSEEMDVDESPRN